MKKQTLGRGLDSLIPRSESRQGSMTTNFNVGLLDIDLTMIIPNDEQPRKKFVPELLKELAESIKSKGVIQPIVVTKIPNNNKYMIIEGERRWRASGLAGKKSIPAILKNTDTPKERLELALITNAQRENLNPVELAKAYDRLMKEYEYRQEDLSIIMGRSRSAVANRLRLLLLPNEILKAIEDDIITEGHARAILSLDKKSKMVSFLNLIIDKKFSVREAERVAKNFGKEVRTKDEAIQSKGYIKEIVSEIEDFFKSKVSIKEKSNGGIIEIKYNSDDQLDTIIKKIRGEVC